MIRLFTYLMDICYRNRFFRKLVWTGIVVFFFVITSAIVFQSSDIETKPIGWEKSFTVSPYAIRAQNVKVAANDNYIIAVYEGLSRQEKGIYVSVSFNGGTSFFAPKKIAVTKSASNNRPHAAISKTGQIAIVWHDFIEDEAINRIFYILSNDLGASWTEPMQLNMGNEFEMHPRVYFDDTGRFHLFYQALSKNSFNLFHAEFNEKKEIVTTGSILSLSKNMRGAFAPDILLNGENMFIVWQARSDDYTEHLYLVKSSDNGESWSSKEKITRSSGNNQAPSIILYNETLYVVYQNNDDKTWSIKLKKGTENGGLWDTDPITISTTDANCFSPEIVRSGREFIIVWYDQRDGSPRVFSRRIGITSEIMSKEVKLSVRKEIARNPEVVFSNNRAVVFWESGRAIRGNFNDTFVAAPVLFSRTHKHNKWSRSNVAVIEWKKPFDESGIAGYATVLNKLPYFDPDPSIVNVKVYVKRRIIPELTDGVTYFHIRAVDNAGNSSRTVHYKIQVASNPLPQPVVFSPTHPESKSSSAKKAVVKWTIENKDRLKGFMYDLSRGSQKQPRKFVKDFSLSFDDLDEGIYFFTISALDKTDRYGKVASYPIVVGKNRQITNEDIRKIIDKSDTLIVEKKKPRKRYLVPVATLMFPFNTTEPYTQKQLKAAIDVKNIRKERIKGYSVSFGKDKITLPDKITQSSDVVTLKNLESGTYYVGVKAQYFTIKNGKKQLFWTRPYTKRINVAIPVVETPTTIYAKNIFERLYQSQHLIFILLFGISLSVLLLGSGVKTAFYLKMLNYKWKLLYQRMIK